MLIFIGTGFAGRCKIVVKLTSGIQEPALGLHTWTSKDTQAPSSYPGALGVLGRAESWPGPARVLPTYLPQTSVPWANEAGGTRRMSTVTNG